MHHPVTPERLKEVLELDLSETMVGQDAGVGTLQGLLNQLLEMVWADEQDFDGKRPFGNSGWQHEVYEEIAKRGWCAITPTLDSEVYPADLLWVDLNLIRPAIRLAMLRKVSL